MTIDKDLLLILKSSGLGDGEPDLGHRLMNGFLTALQASGTLPARIICLNSGIFLTTEGSPVREHLENIAAVGTEILSCRTCLDYFDRLDKLIVGHLTDMNATVEAMLTFPKILSP